MRDESDWPGVDESILRRLDEQYPEKCPEADWTDRQIWIYVGQRSVVRMLRAVYSEQINED